MTIRPSDSQGISPHPAPAARSPAQEVGYSISCAGAAGTQRQEKLIASTTPVPRPQCHQPFLKQGAPPWAHSSSWPSWPGLCWQGSACPDLWGSWDLQGTGTGWESLPGVQGHRAALLQLLRGPALTRYKGEQRHPDLGPCPPAAPGPPKPPAKARGWLGTTGHRGDGTCPPAPHATPAQGTPAGICTPSRRRASWWHCPGAEHSHVGAQPPRQPSRYRAQHRAQGTLTPPSRDTEAMQELMKSTSDGGPAALPQPTPDWSPRSRSPEHTNAGRETLPSSWLSLQTCTPRHGWSWHPTKCLEEDSW